MKLLERLKAYWAAMWPDDEIDIDCAGHMHRIVFNTGDVIVVGTERVLSVEHQRWLEAYLKKRLRGADVVVLDGGITIGIIGMPEAAEVARGA